MCSEALSDFEKRQAVGLCIECYHSRPSARAESDRATFHEAYVEALVWAREEILMTRDESEVTNG
jgi:hypothetical protein